MDKILDAFVRDSQECDVRKTDPEDYRTTLRRELDTRRSALGRNYTQAKMAAACRVQKTYLSRVLSREAHFNRDQLYLACNFLGTKPLERELLLVSFDYHRSELPALRSELKQRFADLCAESDSARGRLQADVVDGDIGNLAEYYLNPNMQLAHIFLSIETFRKNPDQMTKPLGIDLQSVTAIVARLEKLGLVEITKDGIKLTRHNIHLPSESPFYAAHRSLLRHRANDRLNSLSDDAGYTFSVVYSASESDRHIIKTLFLEFLERVEKIVNQAKTEDVYQLNFDLLRWS